MSEVAPAENIRERLVGEVKAGVESYLTSCGETGRSTVVRGHDLANEWSDQVGGLPDGGTAGQSHREEIGRYYGVAVEHVNNTAGEMENRAGSEITGNQVREEMEKLLAGGEGAGNAGDTLLNLLNRPTELLDGDVQEMLNAVATLQRNMSDVDDNVQRHWTALRADDDPRADADDWQSFARGVSDLAGRKVGEAGGKFYEGWNSDRQALGSQLEAARSQVQSFMNLLVAE